MDDDTRNTCAVNYLCEYCGPTYEQLEMTAATSKKFTYVKLERNKGKGKT